MNGGWGISYEIALGWMPQDLTDDKSTLVQVMAWYRHATSHYLSQCWTRSLSPYGITRPLGKELRPNKTWQTEINIVIHILQILHNKLMRWQYRVTLWSQSQLTGAECCNYVVNLVIIGSVSEWLSLTAFVGKVEIGVHVVHTSHVIIAYTLESLSSLT